MGSSDAQSAPPLFVLHEHCSSVLCCSFYPSTTYHRDTTSYFLSGDVDGTVILWNLTTRRPLLSFSAWAEARQQLCTDAQNRSNSDSRGDVGASAAFGPHSQSVISVGFFPLRTESLTSSSEHTTADAPDGKFEATTSQTRAIMDAARGTLVKAATALATTAEPAARDEAPQRQRFRLPRRAAAPAASAEMHLPSSAPQSESGAQGSRPAAELLFYTHCRDQRVYLWKWVCGSSTVSQALSAPHLMAALTAPQHGFCPVESVLTVADGASLTYLAVPHDTGGELTVWEIGWSHARSRDDDAEPVAASANPSPTALPPDASSESDRSDVEEVDTSGMSPMDALIARAAAEERRERGAQKHQTQRPFSAAAVQGPTVANANRVSFLCYVAPAATTSESGLVIRRLCTFSACPRFKGGTIMRLTMCSDAQHIAVAFESGHVVLTQFRNASAARRGQQPLPGLEEDLHRCASGSSFSPQVRCSLRAFAESALACWWSGSRVLACSADGALHCYEVSPIAVEGVATDQLAASPGLQLHLQWSVALRKGIGSVSMQANLIVAGCWDSTLRLYDARDGRLVSILSYQRESINEVRMAPSCIARVAAFGFDARRPKCYAAPTKSVPLIRNGQGDSGHSEEREESGPFVTPWADASATHLRNHEEDLVYLFGSASKDGTVAVWRVDMGVVVERLSMKAIAA